mgnify:CR=1 FL=1
MTWTIHNVDCLDFLRTLPDGSVDAVVTSPPYDNLREYASVVDVAGIANELRRVCIDGGVVVWVVNDSTVKGSESMTSFRHAQTFVSAGFNLHDTMIFAKKNYLPQNNRRYEQAFEYMFVFSVGRPAVVNLITEPCKLAGKINTGTQRHDKKTPTPKYGVGRPCKDTKPRSNIWFYAVGSEGVPEHPAVFPLALAKDHVLSWTDEGMTILDPFAGSGTTGVACIQTGRNFIGCEIDAGYAEIARRRCREAEESVALLAESNK